MDYERHRIHSLASSLIDNSPLLRIVRTLTLIWTGGSEQNLVFKKHQQSNHVVVKTIHMTLYYDCVFVFDFDRTMFLTVLPIIESCYGMNTLVLDKRIPR